MRSLSLLNLTPQDIPRFQSSEIDENGEIVVKGNCGGHQRLWHGQAIRKLKSHPLYITDDDDEENEECAVFRFKRSLW